MKSVKRFLLSLALALPLFAQQPNCQINFGPWPTINTSQSFNNVGFGANNACTYWVFQYQVTGFTAISLQFESATGASAAGAFGAYSGTVASGVNPSTSVACSTPTNCTATFTGMIGWYRVNLTAVTGSGTVTGTLQGYKTGYALGGAAVPGGGCPGTVATPCVVDGVTAAGSVPTTSPVLVGGKDATAGFVRVITTDTSGNIVNDPLGAALALGDARTNTPTQPEVNGTGSTQVVYKFRFNGTNWDRDFNCPSTAAITFTAASGSIQTVALSGATIIRICSISLSSDTVTNITLQNGTGSNCGTGTATLGGVYQNVLSLTIYYGSDGALRAPASNAFCVNSSATATIGGMVTYAQF